MHGRDILGVRLAVVAALLAGGLGCTTARTNARLAPGFSGGITGMALYMPAGRDDLQPTHPRTDPIFMPTAELSGQYAWVSDHGTGLALQLRLPAFYPLASLDLYGQLAGGERWSHGAGLELGLLPAAYYIVTRHEGQLYASFTARALTPLGTNRPGILVTPQLAVGVQGQLDLFGFVTYARAVGWEPDFESESDTHRDYRSQWLLAGIGLRI
jgi:hypothetical protein